MRTSRIDRQKPYPIVNSFRIEEWKCFFFFPFKRNRRLRQTLIANEIFIHRIGIENNTSLASSMRSRCEFGTKNGYKYGLWSQHPLSSIVVTILRWLLSLWRVAMGHIKPLLLSLLALNVRLTIAESEQIKTIQPKANYFLFNSIYIRFIMFFATQTKGWWSIWLTAKLHFCRRTIWRRAIWRRYCHQRRNIIKHWVGWLSKVGIKYVEARTNLEIIFRLALPRFYAWLVCHECHLARPNL